MRTKIFTWKIRAAFIFWSETNWTPVRGGRATNNIETLMFEWCGRAYPVNEIYASANQWTSTEYHVRKEESTGQSASTWFTCGNLSNSFTGKGKDLSFVYLSRIGMDRTPSWEPREKMESRRVLSKRKINK